MTKRAAIYARVSTDLQRENYSIPEQVKDCSKYAERKGYALVGDRFVNPETGEDTITGTPAYVDDYTSSELSRPALDAALSYLKDQGFDVLIVAIMDRWARDPHYAMALIEQVKLRGAVVEFVDGQYSDDLQGEIDMQEDALDGKKEVARFVRRSKKGKLAKARDGLYVCGIAPYGYRMDQTAKGGLGIVPEQVEIVRQIFEHYNSGYSLGDISRKLNECGAPRNRGNTWHNTTIRRILTNTTYTGFTHYNRTDYRGRDENGHNRRLKDVDSWVRIETIPIIDQFTFDLAQEKLQKNKLIRQQLTPRKYLLSGYLFCEDCKHPYTGYVDPPRQRRKVEYVYYRHRKSLGHCCNRIAGAKKLDAAVWAKIEELLLKPESIYQGHEEAIQKERETHERQIILRGELEKAADKIKRAKSSLIKIYSDPDIGMSKDEFISTRKDYDKQLDEINERMRVIDGQLALIPNRQSLEDLRVFTEKIRERLLSGKWKPTIENKRQVLRLLHAEVYLSTKGNSGRISGWFGDDLVFRTDDDHRGQPLVFIHLDFHNRGLEPDDRTG